MKNSKLRDASELFNPSKAHAFDDEVEFVDSKVNVSKKVDKSEGKNTFIHFFY